jgi:hypothetical protein
VTTWGASCLPGEPDRGFSEDLPLLPEGLDLRRRRRTSSRSSVVSRPGGGRHRDQPGGASSESSGPTAQNGGRALLGCGPSGPARRAASATQGDTAVGLRHRGLPPPPKGNSVHATGSSPESLRGRPHARTAARRGLQSIPRPPRSRSRIVLSCGSVRRASLAGPHAAAPPSWYLAHGAFLRWPPWPAAGFGFANSQQPEECAISLLPPSPAWCSVR